ncbi:hypothetical protein GDO86_001068, partial [Hymenochirus boettgeri]
GNELSFQELLDFYGYEASDPLSDPDGENNSSDTEQCLSSKQSEEPEHLSLELEEIPPSLLPSKSPNLFPCSPGNKEQQTPVIAVGEKEIISGSQAQIPNLHCTPPTERDCEGKDQLLWDPNVLPEQEVEEYLVQVHELQHRARGGYSHEADLVWDNEQALYELVKCEFNIEEALRRLYFNVKVVKGGLNAWSKDEQRNFEHGFRVHGKNFHLIQANKVRTRSVGECVQFYYLWKKSEHYEVFRQTRLGKRKAGNQISVEYEFNLPESECPLKLRESSIRGGSIEQTGDGVGSNSLKDTTCKCNKVHCSCRLIQVSGIDSTKHHQEVPTVTGDLINLRFSHQTMPLLPGLKAQDASSFSMAEMSLSDFLTPSLLCTASIPNLSFQASHMD